MHPLRADPTDQPVDAARAKATQEVLKLERDWVTAEEKHDEATLRHILDEKFIASFGAKPPKDKEGFIKGELKGDVDPTTSQTLTDQMVIVDGDTAIVTGTDTLRGTKQGEAYTLVARYTATYIRRNGRWVALAEHMVAVPPAK
jgi:ketosteroid isomerase-like protein